MVHCVHASYDQTQHIKLQTTNKNSVVGRRRKDVIRCNNAISITINVRFKNKTNWVKLRI